MNLSTKCMYRILFGAGKGQLYSVIRLSKTQEFEKRVSHLCLGTSTKDSHICLGTSTKDG